MPPLDEKSRKLLEEAVRELKAIPSWMMCNRTRAALAEGEAALAVRPKLTLIQGGRS